MFFKIQDDWQNIYTFQIADPAFILLFPLIFLTGWATLTVMGPVVAVKMAYRLLYGILARAFFSDKALCGKVMRVEK